MKKSTRIVLSVATLATLSIHILNKLESIKAMKKYNNSNDIKSLYPWQFGTITYHVKGTGNPVLLIHSLNIGSSSKDFDKIVNDLSKTNTVYTIDLVGYGASEKPNILYTNYLYTQLITDFIRDVITKKTNVIGIGDAAGIIVPICHKEKNLINDIVLINPETVNNMNSTPTAKEILLKKFIHLPIFGTMLYNIIGSELIIKQNYKKLYYYNPLNVTEDEISNNFISAHLNNYKAKYSYCCHVAGYTSVNIVHALKEINNNITIISGSDIENKDSINKSYKDLNPSIDIIEIPVTKAYPHMEDPKNVLHHLSYILK
ncbi:MAG: hypothetical protein R3Y47_00115 [Lachnospiraceae bacterium]